MELDYIIKADVPNTLSKLKNAGLTVRIMTEDSKESAILIAKECQII
jgi:magnesium-transporting ATPase (P-type)